MSRDQYINEVRRKSLVILFNAMRRIIAHPLNRLEYTFGAELRAAGCTALDYASEGRVPRYITGTEGSRNCEGGVWNFPKQPTRIRWCHAVLSKAYMRWEWQRPSGAGGYWWPNELDQGAIQHRLRAIDNIIKDLTPASVSRNKREGKFLAGRVKVSHAFVEGWGVATYMTLGVHTRTGPTK